MSTVSVRYLVDDVDAAIDCYCGQLGFDEQMHPDPAFAMLTRGDLDALRPQGVRFRNEIVSGIGSRQILVQDPAGNLVELFEPLRPEARLST